MKKLILSIVIVLTLNSCSTEEQENKLSIPKEFTGNYKRNIESGVQKAVLTLNSIDVKSIGTTEGVFRTQGTMISDTEMFNGSGRVFRADLGNNETLTLSLDRGINLTDPSDDNLSIIIQRENNNGQWVINGGFSRE